MNKPCTHCPDCGEPVLPEATWPHTCHRCSAMHFLNPIPVAVLLVPVAGGLLTVRRAIDPGKGKLSLPGGYIDLGESWQQAAVREALEETGLMLDVNAVEHFDTVSAPDGTVLIYGVVPEIEEGLLDGFEPSREVSALEVCTSPATLAFPLHTAAMRAWFEARVALSRDMSSSPPRHEA